MDFKEGDVVVYLSDGWDNIPSGRIGQIAKIVEINQYSAGRSNFSILLEFRSVGGPFGDRMWWTGERYIAKARCFNRRCDLV